MQMEVINFYLALLTLWVFVVSVKADFDFTVRFYEYWNPTGLCAECGTNGVPVCCDDPLLTKSCQNTGVFRCDTRFRYILRPFNAAPLEAAPNTGFPFFTPSHTNENHQTFYVGDGGVVGSSNPSTLSTTSPWTGRIQLLVDAVDRFNTANSQVIRNETTGIIDRFLINLDQLQLGGDLTEETNYTGIHNISQLSISFQVECSENYYGSDCTTFCEAVEGVYNCDSNGSIVCVEETRDPTTQCINCSQNYYGPNCTTFCGAVEGVYNCDSNGSVVCVEKNHNASTRCINCSENFYGPDCTTFCEAVEGVSRYDSDGNIVCVNENRYPFRNCTIEPQAVSAALVGGVVGGIAALLLVILLIINVVQSLLIRQLMGRTSSNANNESLGVDSLTQQQTPDNIEMKQNTVYGVNSTQTGNVDTEVNQAYGVTSQERPHERREPDSTQAEYEYVQV